jgi:hypothetical protein
MVSPLCGPQTASVDDATAYALTPIYTVQLLRTASLCSIVDDRPSIQLATGNHPSASPPSPLVSLGATLVYGFRSVLCVLEG